MERLERIAQLKNLGKARPEAVKPQAPWRRQLQFIGLFSLILVLIALVAGIYLNVSARAAAVGRDIQTMQQRIEDLDQEIENLQSALAAARASDEMEQRARQKGFAPVQSEQLVYLPVPGFAGRQPATMAPPYYGRVVVAAPVLPAEYTESLFDWLARFSKQQFEHVSFSTFLGSEATLGSETTEVQP